MANPKSNARPEFEVLAQFDYIGSVIDTRTVLKRKALRVDVQYFTPAVLIQGLGHPSRTYRLKSIAELGASVITEETSLSHLVGQVMNSQIIIGAIQIPLRSRIAYFSPNLTGVEFIDPTPSSRLALRTHFFFELGVASLGTDTKVDIKDSGRNRVLSYGEADGRGMEIQLEGTTIHAFRVGLTHIGAEVRWDRENVIQVLIASNEAAPQPYLRNQVICFLRNVRGLNPLIRKSLENIVADSPMKIQLI